MPPFRTTNPSMGMETSCKFVLEVASIALSLPEVWAMRRETRPPKAKVTRSNRVGCANKVIGTDPFFTSRAQKLGATSLRLRMPAIYQYREFTAAGGVMSYGGSIVDSYHHAGLYVGRILKGEKPGDLPVQLSTKVELFLNLKSAKALGLSVPLPLLGRADEVIE
jgi:putative tryptophan/tyrosine transport system substrate-binding protein